MDLTKRIAIAAGALTMGLAGVAAAGTTTPDAADAGLTKASENVGVELPASHDSQPGADAGQNDIATEDTASDDTSAEVEDEAGSSEDNHGAIVSAVAQSEFDSGREHGEAVSVAARDNHGANPSGDELDDELNDGDEDDDADERQDDAGDRARS